MTDRIKGFLYLAIAVMIVGGLLWTQLFGKDEERPGSPAVYERISR